MNTEGKIINPLEFPIKFEDYRNTSNRCWHKKPTTTPRSHPSDLPEESSPKLEPLEEWLMEVKHSFKAIQILSPSTTMPCSLRGTVVKALYNPTIESSIM